MEPSTVKDLLVGDERFAPDVISVWTAVEAGSARRRVTRRRFVIGGVAAGVAAIAAGTTLAQQRPGRVALPGPSPTISTMATSQPASPSSTTAGSLSSTSPTSVAASPLVPAASLAKGRWRTSPTAPIAARSGAVGVWTGTEMLVWGGTSNNRLSADGAAYDPAHRRWRRIPPAPAAARANWTGIWTGHSLILWGVAKTGQDTPPTGARYTPETDRWQMLPDPPIGVSATSTTVWTGSVMVALAVPTGDNPELIAAAMYDPVHNSWTALPPVPLPAGHPVQFLQAVAAEGIVYLWSRWQRDNGDFSTAGTDGFLLDKATWRPVTFTGDDGVNGSVPISTGASLVQPAARVWQGVNAGPDPANMTGRLLNPSSKRVTDIAQGPLDHQAPQSIWTGNALISLTFQGAVAAWDIATDKWIHLPHAPSAFDENPLTVWTGSSLLLWGRTEQLKTGNDAPKIVSSGLEFTT